MRWQIALVRTSIMLQTCCVSSINHTVSSWVDINHAANVSCVEHQSHCECLGWHQSCCKRVVCRASITLWVLGLTSIMRQTCRVSSINHTVSAWVDINHAANVSCVEHQSHCECLGWHQSCCKRVVCRASITLWVLGLTSIMLQTCRVSSINHTVSAWVDINHAANVSCVEHQSHCECLGWHQSCCKRVVCRASITLWVHGLTSIMLQTCRVSSINHTVSAWVYLHMQHNKYRPDQWHFIDDIPRVFSRLSFWYFEFV